jgi:hypothetical protein
VNGRSWTAPLSLSQTYTRMYWWCSPPKIGTGRGRVRRDRSPKFNLARATKRTYIHNIVPRPPAPLIRGTNAYFAGASPLSIGDS